MQRNDGKRKREDTSEVSRLSGGAIVPGSLGSNLVIQPPSSSRLIQIIVEGHVPEVKRIAQDLSNVSIGQNRQLDEMGAGVYVLGGLSRV